MNMIRSTSAFAFAILLAATAASAQDTAAAASRRATFEVASVKPSNPDPTNPLSMVPMAGHSRADGSRSPIPAADADRRFAYEMQDFRVDGGPPALMSAKFDIIAKASGGARSRRRR